MAMAGRSVHITQFFLGKLEQTVNQYFVPSSWDKGYGKENMSEAFKILPKLWSIINSFEAYLSIKALARMYFPSIP